MKLNAAGTAFVLSLLCNAASVAAWGAFLYLRAKRRRMPVEAAAPDAPPPEPARVVASPRVPPPAVVAPPLPVPEPAGELVSKLEWNLLMRDAKDGGANSILAAHIMKKTSEVLSGGRLRVDLMIETVSSVEDHANQLTAISSTISDIAVQSKLVSFNAVMEAARAGENGQTFRAVSEQMSKLAFEIKKLNEAIGQKISGIKEKVTLNKEFCLHVGKLFERVSMEMGQFHKLMARIEQLSTSQSAQLSQLEHRISDSGETPQA